MGVDRHQPGTAGVRPCALALAASVVAVGAAVVGCGGESVADSGGSGWRAALNDVPAALLAEPTPEERAAAVALGQQLWLDNNCASCHVDEANQALGPTLEGVMYTTVEFINGETTDRTPAYMYRSIVSPHEVLVNGYGRTMLAYEYLGEESVIALVRYIESLSDPATPGANGGADAPADGGGGDP